MSKHVLSCVFLEFLLINYVNEGQHLLNNFLNRILKNKENACTMTQALAAS